MYKPVILIGNGLRHNPRMVDYLCSLNIPVLTTWMSADLVADDNPAFCGRPGLLGQRAANIIQQKADALVCFGARLDGDQVAHNLAGFSPNAEKVVFDIDKAELDKLPGGADWGKYCGDLNDYTGKIKSLPDAAWLTWCKALYNSDFPNAWYESREEYVNPRCVADWLSNIGTPDDVFAIGSSGQAPCTFLQAFRVKKGQRITDLSTFGPMGADIPMAIGACLGSGGRRTICVTGDGGFMLNIQELEVVRRLNLPIKFLVYNNGGYNSIRQMQIKRFGGRLVGADETSGLTLPPLERVAHSYGMRYRFANNGNQLQALDGIMNSREPAVIDLNMDPNFIQYPRVDSTMGADGVPVPDSMENMTPYLAENVLRELMEWGNE
jgi:acetolactate synthase-1/2/3 large subunit